MANHDVLNDPTPKLLNNRPTLPTVSAMRAAILASPQAASYPAARLDAATKNDLIGICKAHSIAVAGL
jgi:hypothetical protein